MQSKGDRTTKGLLVYWTFKEMRRVRKLAEKLVQMPLGEGKKDLRAGPPFELPYQLNISTEEVDRWAGHVDVFEASNNLIRDIIRSDPDTDDAFLAHLLADDANSLAIARSLAQGFANEAETTTAEFLKVARILDEAVRGFSINGFHGAFWRDVTLDGFLGSFVDPVDIGNPDNSAMIQRIELPEDDPRRMPYYRPRIDQSRLDYVRDWVKRGAPDSEPSGQIGIASEPSPKAEADTVDQVARAVFSMAEAPGFEKDIKPLFREMPDRSSMLFVFDLHNYDHVKEHAIRILETLVDGSMPCTGRWPEERIQLFRNWIDTDFGR